MDNSVTFAPPNATLKEKVKAQIMKVTRRKSTTSSTSSSSSSSVCSHFYEHLPSSIGSDTTISPDDCPAMLGERHSLPLPGSPQRLAFPAKPS
ncbi:hypothetical protein FRB94_003957 [Tulasnella sp. JGI-2019a]|nr:hypothetical protein FRB94_003957 [Tulasnella sp. JGI-2019a]KAG9008209.1 hypothetical protein FRB93_006777 [Tulasnella sp. JGI-2019a]KAG9025899.1 hypothetical protein FRB95_009647 [Tulasnella sp. JGI-2019a]